MDPSVPLLEERILENEGRENAEEKQEEHREQGEEGWRRKTSEEKTVVAFAGLMDADPWYGPDKSARGNSHDKYEEFHQLRRGDVEESLKNDIFIQMELQQHFHYQGR
ncbi:hypothetical protein NDU88_002082 [Pleurodeles waltl]|uniref:Uncharacterized protein n=1 Tax=Pleurodeles waltl TaxID=8319 RepID=A0AAV7MRQ8_PLEWA|nr:hypothetical protein NDU88_002082 [Pleurodeles waltl]